MADGHLLFVWKTSGYELREQDGDVVDRGEIGGRDVMSACRRVCGRAARERAPPGKRVQRQHARNPPCEAQRQARWPHVRDADLAFDEELVKLGVEGALHVRGAAGEDEGGAAGGRVLDFEAVARQPGAQRRDVRVRGAEALLELRGEEPPSKVRRSGILLGGEKSREDVRVPLRQDEEDAVEAGVAVESRDVAGARHLPRDLANGRKDFVRPRPERGRRDEKQAENGRARRRPSGAAAAEEIDRPRHARNRQHEEERDGRHDEQGDERQEDRDEALQEGEDVLGEGDARVRDARRECRRRQARGALHEVGDEGDRPAGPSGDDVEKRRPFGLDASDRDERTHDGPDERMEKMPEVIEPWDLVGEEFHQKEHGRDGEGRRRAQDSRDRARVVLRKEARHRPVYEQHRVGVEARRRRESEAGAEELGKSARHRAAFAVMSWSATCALRFPGSSRMTSLRAFTRSGSFRSLR